MSGEFHRAIEDVNYLLENDENEESLSCDLCNVKVSSTKTLQRHLEGRKHKMKVERQGKTFGCELCDVVANSEIQLNTHLNSTKHKHKVARLECAEFTTVSTSWGLWIVIFCVVCVFINLLLLFKIIIT